MKWLRRCHAEILSGLAAWRRQRGHYDRRLLALAWLAWRTWPDAARWQRLQRVRRDLGLPPHLEPTSVTAPVAEGSRSAAVDEAISTLQMRQLRARFTAWVLEETRHGAMCVVGNARRRDFQATAEEIDAHPVVVRFNRWMPPMPVDGAVGSRNGRGQRGQIWVLSPSADVTLECAPSGCPWVVYSGADPLARLPHWPFVLALREFGAQVLTVPLTVWRPLVSELEAPPSAGLLMLAWFKEMTGTWRGIHISGFEPGPGGGHVLGVRHRLTHGGRHDWQREAALLKRWRGEGLLDLDLAHTTEGFQA